MQHLRPSPRVRVRASGYTLVEVLIAVGIISLAIAAASQLSMSLSLQEEVNQKKSVALNYVENNARLWQLGIDNPADFLLREKTIDTTTSPASESWMTATISATTSVELPVDSGTAQGAVDKVTVSVSTKPPGKPDATVWAFSALRLKPIHR